MMAAEALGLAAAVTAAWVDPTTATERIELALATAAASGVELLGGDAAVMLAITRLAGGAEAARTTADETLRWAIALGNRETACAATLVLGAIRRVLGQDASEDAYRALTDATRAGLRPLVPDALDLIAGLALDGGRIVVAARLHAASHRLRGELGCVLSPLAALMREKDEPAVAGRLEAVDLAAAHREGAALTTAQAVSYATRSRGRRTRPSSGWASLTPTELDVVNLAAAGRATGPSATNS
jgi:hypothetical protein